MLLFAPNLNSYRRFQRGTHAPLAPSWGYENRTVAVRVPADEAHATRIEHRVAGADANPYLVVAVILAGMLHGIDNDLEAPAPLEGNAYEQLPPSLPRYWPDALARFEDSEFISEYFGERWRASRIRNSSANISAKSFARCTRFSSGRRSTSSIGM
jgi:glutamine synthetase